MQDHSSHWMYMLCWFSTCLHQIVAGMKELSHYVYIIAVRFLASDNINTLEGCLEYLDGRNQNYQKLTAFQHDFKVNEM